MAALVAMTAAILHRGPDEGGHHLASGVALGMRRLSIIGLAGSHQPIANEAGSVSAVFNGEIYNFPVLRSALVRRGHRLSTAGDTETIVHLYEDHGIDFPRHLRGMFAIAVWDAELRQLVLVRDRMGVKPLYYATTSSGLAFASEVKSLIAGGLVKPALDPLAAELFGLRLRAGATHAVSRGQQASARKRPGVARGPADRAARLLAAVGRSA